MVRNGAAEFAELLVGWQLAVEQQKTGREKVRVLGNLFDRVAAIKQFALVAIDEGNLRGAVGRRCEAWIVGKTARVLVQLTDVHDGRPNGAVAQRKLGR